MNLQGIRSSVSLLGSQYSQYKERKREKESESGIVCRIRADGSRRGETGFPLTLSRSKLLKGWIVIAKERSYKGGNVCIFNEFARAFPGSESMGNTISVSDLWIFFFLLSFSGFPKRRKARTCRRNLPIGASTASILECSCFSLFVIRNVFFYFFFYCIIKKRNV